MANNNLSLNFQKLGKSMKIYAWGIILLQVLSFILGLILGLSLVNMTITNNPEQSIYNFIESSKNIVIYSGVLVIIIYISFGNFIKEIFNLKKNNNEFSDILNKTFLILLIGLICQIIVDIISLIISYRTLIELQAVLSSFSTMNETEITQLINGINTSNFLNRIIILIPLGLVLYGYFTFKQFGNKLKLSNFENPNSINVDNGMKFLLLGSIINLFVGFLNLIPDAPLLGLLGFISIIITLIGLFKTGIGFVSYSRTGQLYKSPNMYSSQDTYQNFSSQDQMGSYNQNSPQELSGISVNNTEYSGKFCHICGTKQIDSNSKYCMNCGTPLN